MLASRGGVIVNTATTDVLNVVPHMTAFTAFKHGSVELTKSVAKDYASRNIRANVLCPGATATPMLLGWLPNLGMTAEAMGAAIPSGRMARPEEQAEAAVWLCSPGASYVAGIVLPVDGGGNSVDRGPGACPRAGSHPPPARQAQPASNRNNLLNRKPLPLHRKSASPKLGNPPKTNADFVPP